MQPAKLTDVADFGQKMIFAIPAIHFSACILFILGYTFSFGGNIISLVGAGDIFSVSLRDLSYVYLTLSLLIFSKIKTIRMYRPYAQDRLEAIVDAGVRNLEYSKLKKIRTSLRIFIVAVSIFSIVLSVVMFNRDNPYYPLPIGYAVIFLMPTFRQEMQAVLNIDAKLAESLDLVTVVLIISMCFGLSFGARDKQTSFSEFRDESIYCNDVVLVRSLSDKFLAINTKSQWVIVDEDCKVKFNVKLQ